jgi:hypothetical protein
LSIGDGKSVPACTAPTKTFTVSSRVSL